MADLSDVSNALVSLIAQTVYPGGTGQPSAVTAPIRVYAGWPQSEQLNADLLSGKCHISVFPSKMERNSTRYLRQWVEMPVSPPTITLTQNGQQITIGGTVSACNVSFLVGGQNYVYAVQSTDTLTGIATALAALIPGASNAGAVITLSSSANIQSLRVGLNGTMYREVRRQEKQMMLCIWTPTPALRDQIAILIDAALVDLMFITMPDQSLAHVAYQSTFENDEKQKAALYRRDLNYLIEYATTEIAGATQVTQVSTSISSVNGSGVTLATATINS